jgi:drug/metabolite transporter (DMT)-like permease
MLAGILFFSESLTALQVVGSILIFCSVGLIVKNPRSLSLDRGTILGLLTGAVFGLAVVAWSYVGRHTDGLSWAAISFIGTALVAYVVRPSSIHKMRPLIEGRLLRRLLLLGALYGTGSLAMLFAYKEGAFSIVTPLRQTSIIVTVLLALLFLAKERNRVGIKLLAAFICFSGVILIVM